MKHVGVRPDEFGNLFFYIYYSHEVHQSDILDAMPSIFFPFASYPPPPPLALVDYPNEKKTSLLIFAGKNWKEVMATGTPCFCYLYTPTNAWISA